VIDPDLVLSALSLGGQDRHTRRRQKAIDQPVSSVWSGTAAERLELIKPLAHAVHQRLKTFGLAG
jgi:hypothetical protein